MNNKSYKIGTTMQNQMVVWSDGEFRVTKDNIYSDNARQDFMRVDRSYFAKPLTMKSLTCTGAKLLQSKVQGFKVLSPGCDLADAWVKQNNGFVPFDSRQFAVVRSPDDVSAVSELRYIGEESVHVTVPDGVRHADRMFCDRYITSCDLPDSVETAYDIGGMSNKDDHLDLVRELKDSPVYLEGKKSHSDGWVMPKNCCMLGYSREHVPHYKFQESYPVVWYRQGDMIHEHSPLRGDMIVKEDIAVLDMLAMSRSPEGISLTDYGMRIVDDYDRAITNDDLPEYKIKGKIADLVQSYLRENECSAPVKDPLYSFDERAHMNFGDLGFNIKCKAADFRINSNDIDAGDFDFSWTSNGHYADGTNFRGGRFEIPEGILQTDNLFKDDKVLKNGVVIPKSVESANQMYMHSQIETMPEFHRDSHLKSMDSMCEGCSNLREVPELPENVASYNRAFLDTAWDNDSPILNKQDGVQTKDISDIAYDFDEIDLSNHEVEM